MKLRNKKTREIGYFCFANWNDPVLIIMDKDGIQLAKYNSLAEMNEDWEDAPEETKEYWFISTTGEAHRFEGEDKTYTPGRKQLGNYLETKEEAEKAVEKLKAWKRLKDKGFRFNSCKIEMSEIIVPKITITAFINTEEPETLNFVNLLFGGEE